MDAVEIASRSDDRAHEFGQPGQEGDISIGKGSGSLGIYCQHTEGVVAPAQRDAHQ